MLLEKDRFFKFSIDDIISGGHHDDGGSASSGKPDGGSVSGGNSNKDKRADVHIDYTGHGGFMSMHDTYVNTNYDVLYWWTGDVNNYPGPYNKSTGFAARRSLKSKLIKGAYKYTWQEIKEKFIIVNPLQEAGCLSDGERTANGGMDYTYRTIPIQYPLQFKATSSYKYDWSFNDAKIEWNPVLGRNGTGFKVVYPNYEAGEDGYGTYSYNDNRWYKYPVYKNGYEPYEYRIRKAEKLQGLLQLYLPINPDNNFSIDFWEKVFTKQTELLKTLNFYLTKIREIKEEIIGIKESLLGIDFDTNEEGQELTTRQLVSKLQELASKLDIYIEKYQTADKLKVSLFDNIIKSEDEDNVIPVPASCNFYYNYNTYKYTDGRIYERGSDKPWKLVAFNSMLPKIKEWGTKTNTKRPTGTPSSGSLREVWDTTTVYIKNPTFYKAVKLNVAHKTFCEYEDGWDEEDIMERYVSRYGRWVYSNGGSGGSGMSSQEYWHYEWDFIDECEAAMDEGGATWDNFWNRWHNTYPELFTTSYYDDVERVNVIGYSGDDISMLCNYTSPDLKTDAEHNIPFTFLTGMASREWDLEDKQLHLNLVPKDFEVRVVVKKDNHYYSKLKVYGEERWIDDIVGGPEKRLTYISALPEPESILNEVYSAPSLAIGNVEDTSKYYDLGEYKLRGFSFTSNNKPLVQKAISRNSGSHPYSFSGTDLYIDFVPADNSYLGDNPNLQPIEFRITDEEFKSYTTVVDRSTIPNVAEVNRNDLYMFNEIFEHKEEAGDGRVANGNADKGGSLIYEACINYTGTGNQKRRNNIIDPSFSDYQMWHVADDSYLQTIVKVPEAEVATYPGLEDRPYVSNVEPVGDQLTTQTDAWGQIIQDIYNKVQADPSIGGNEKARSYIKAFLALYHTSFAGENITSKITPTEEGSDSRIRLLNVSEFDLPARRFSSILSGTTPVMYKGVITGFEDTPTNPLDDRTADQIAGTVNISLLDSGILQPEKKNSRTMVYLTKNSRLYIWDSSFIKPEETTEGNTVNRRYILAYNLKTNEINSFDIAINGQLDVNSNDDELINMFSFNDEEYGLWKVVEGNKITYKVSALPESFNDTPKSNNPTFSYSLTKGNDDPVPNFYLDLFTADEIEKFDFNSMCFYLNPAALDADHYYHKNVIAWQPNTEIQPAVIELNEDLGFNQESLTSNNLECWILVEDNIWDNFEFGYGEDLNGIEKVPEFITLFRVGESSKADFASYINQYEEGVSVFSRFPTPWMEDIIRENFFENASTELGQFEFEPMKNDFDRNIVRIIPFDSTLKVDDGAELENAETVPSLYWKNLIVKKNVQSLIFEEKIKRKTFNICVGTENYLQILPEGTDLSAYQDNYETVYMLGIDVPVKDENGNVTTRFLSDNSVFGDILPNTDLVTADIKALVEQTDGISLTSYAFLDSAGKKEEDILNDCSFIPAFKKGSTPRNLIRENPCKVYEATVQDFKKTDGEYVATLSAPITPSGNAATQKGYGNDNLMSHGTFEDNYINWNDWTVNKYRLELADLSMKRLGPNKNLKKIPIGSIESVETESKALGLTRTLKTDNTEIYIPNKGYGQKAYGEFLTPNNDPFRDGIFYQKGRLVNFQGEGMEQLPFLLVDENGKPNKYKDALGNPREFRFDSLVPTYKTFEAADNDLDIYLEPKADNLENLIIDLRNIEVEDTGDSINLVFERTSRCNPDWFTWLEALQSTKEKHECKLVISSAKFDFKSNQILKFNQTDQSNKVSNNGIFNNYERDVYILQDLDNLNPTRQFSGEIPDGTEYRNAANEKATIRNANIKDNRYRSVDEDGNIYYIDNGGNLNTNVAQKRNTTDLYGIKSMGLYDEFSDLLRCCKVSSSGDKTGIYGGYLMNNFLIKLSESKTGITLTNSSRHTTIYTVEGLRVKGTQTSYIMDGMRHGFELGLQQDIRISYRQTRFGKSNILVLRDKDGNRISVSVFDKDIKIGDNIFIASSI